MKEKELRDLWAVRQPRKFADMPVWKLGDICLPFEEKWWQGNFEIHPAYVADFEKAKLQATIKDLTTNLHWVKNKVVEPVEGEMINA